MSLVANTAELAHGFTMADVDRAARIAASRAKAPMLGYDERKDIAWMAIVEAIYASDERPENLGQIGFTAISQEATDVQRHHGKLSYRKLERDEWAPHFAIYWRAVAGSGSFSEQVEERVALGQVLGALTAEEYDVIATLAAFGNHAAAAEALCLTRTTFTTRLMRVRRKINALWLAPETPVGPRKRADGKCSYGHDLDEHGYQSKTRDHTLCRVCLRNAARRRRARVA
ncbi:hypothetical protein EUA93_18855 [Nocardioides oleivorans]|uniref:Uncharacterized protein n=1 Tax=Nocardioides oleivorans TaxID=273676 RepID=A0A4Q2RR39_9ACTN|nr:hypothetical protein [Nocardioides oleivorans]RYB90996.1 hypothetical protein EUA93_18855 [Nocardioides oleivorans]